MAIHLLFALVILALAFDASAFKLKTHVIVANRSWTAITGPAATATIDVPGIGVVPLHNAEVVEAVRAYPAYYRAGTLGPDVYPDLIGGQLWVHPNKGN